MWFLNVVGFSSASAYLQAFNLQLHLLEFEELGGPPLGLQMGGENVWLKGKLPTVMGALRKGPCRLGRSYY